MKTQQSTYVLITTTIPENKWGVHETHCCKEHGCKYGDKDCPVVLGLIKQAYPCMDDDINTPCFPNRKDLYVTVQEFLDNGGELKPERELYSQKQDRSYWLFGYFLKQDEQGYLVAHNASFKSMPINLTTFFVKIEATPIYK